MKQLLEKVGEARSVLVQAIMDYVREHGEDYTTEPLPDYYRDEFGIDDEEEGGKVVRLLDVSDPGCFFAVQLKVNDDDIHDQCEEDDYRNAAWAGFEHYAIWALYIVRDAEGNESLKYYMFTNPGICYSDDSEPDHDNVCTLTLAGLYYIIEAIEKSETTN